LKKFFMLPADPCQGKTWPQKKRPEEEILPDGDSPINWSWVKIYAMSLFSTILLCAIAEGL